MKWRENTPDTKLAPGTELLGLARRGPFSSDTAPEWHRTIYPLVVGRVGTICRDEEREDRDKIVWYGHNYQSASDPQSYSHYLLLSDLPELPPLPEPTERDIASYEEGKKRSAARAAAMVAALKAIYSEERVAELLRKEEKA